jgi:hypothetical protein
MLAGRLPRLLLRRTRKVLRDEKDSLRNALACKLLTHDGRASRGQ